jgi:hypothetical protein
MKRFLKKGLKIAVLPLMLIVPILHAMELTTIKVQNLIWGQLWEREKERFRLEIVLLTMNFYVFEVQKRP